jgi:TIR domain
MSGKLSRDMAAPVEIFYSYAHEDQELVHEVRSQLMLFERNKIITSWYDRLIPAGSDWKGQIDERLRSADIILLLVSPHFFASDYCHDNEMQEAMRRHDAKLATVIPVILRPCPWEAAPLARLQALPSGGKPVTEWHDRAAACLDVAHNVMAVVRHVESTLASAPVLRPEDVPTQAPLVSSGPPSSAEDPEFRDVHCESGSCRSPNVAVTDSAEITQLEATEDGWLARGTVRLDYKANGECLTCGRIFTIVSRSIAVQFPDITCAGCGESAFLRYRIQSLTKTAVGYRFEVVGSCQKCHGVRRVAHLLPELARTASIEFQPTGLNVHLDRGSS